MVTEARKLTRRTVVTSAISGGAALALAGCGADMAQPGTAATPIDVDFGATQAFPLLKSKIGVARALDTTEIIDSLPYLDQIRPAVYNAEIRFPDRTSPAMSPYPFRVGSDGDVQVASSAFLRSLFSGLTQRRMEIMVQLEGAPYPWGSETHLAPRRPHTLPLPNDLSAAAAAVGKWTRLYSDYPISWCIWNEPEHNLTGSPDLASVTQIAEVYKAYTSAIAPQGLFGLASFISMSEPVRTDLGNRTYVQAALDAVRSEIKSDPDLPFDYLTMNSYGEDLQKLWGAARNALGTDFNTVPLIQAQSGAFLPAEWITQAGTVLEAARSMSTLLTALETPDVQTFTFSGWIGHLIKYSGTTATRLPLFDALQLYTRMPDNRRPVRGDLPSGIGAMASGDADRSAVMVWNETDRPIHLRLQLTDLPSSGNGDTVVSVYSIDDEHARSSPAQEGGLAPTTTRRVAAGTRSLSETVTVAGPGLVYVEAGRSTSHPVLDRTGLTSPLVRKHTYADRVADAEQTISVRGNAYGCFDAVRSIAYCGVGGSSGTGLVGAEYRDLPPFLPVSVLASSLGRSAGFLGIRVDYLVAGEARKVALWRGSDLTTSPSSALPWGRGGVAADVVVRTAQLNSDAEPGTFTLALQDSAPSGWAAAGAHAIISFWMDSTGPGSQARFLLG